MSIKKIPCGGFMYDDDTVEFEDGVMRAKGGGSGGGAMVVHFEIDDTTGEVSADKTPSEVLNAMLSKSVIGVLTLSDSVYPIGSAFASVDGRFIAFYEPAGESGLLPIMAGSVQSDVWELQE